MDFADPAFDSFSPAILAFVKNEMIEINSEILCSILPFSPSLALIRKDKINSAGGLVELLRCERDQRVELGHGRGLVRWALRERSV